MMVKRNNRISRFIYLDRPLDRPLKNLDVGEQLKLNSEAVKYLERIMRCQPGEILLVSDGNGAVADCRWLGGHHCQIEQINFWPLPCPLLTLAFPRIKEARLKWLIEKSVEVGVDRLIQFNSDYQSISQLPGINRQLSWIKQAAGQSLRSYLPAFSQVQNLKDLFKLTTFSVCLSIDGEPLIDSLSKINSQADGFSEIIILVGPEGGFSPRENEIVRQAAVKPVALGKRRLRTETAATLALGLFEIFLRT